MKLEQSCAAAKYQICRCNRMAVEINQRTTDDQVLLNL